MTKIPPNNIINFPNAWRPSSPQTPEEIAAALLEYKTMYSDEIAEMLWQTVLGELGRTGCDFNKNIGKYFPAMVLVLESIRSLHLLTQEIEHPLQQFALDTIHPDDFEQIMVDIDDEMD